MNYNFFNSRHSNWNYVKMNEIVNLRQGLQISSKLRKPEWAPGYIPLLKIMDLATDNYSEFVKDIKSQYMANKEDIIYTRTGQVGLVYTNKEGCVHNNCFKVEYDNRIIDKDYLYYFLKNPLFKELANNVASGSVQKDLTHSAFKNLPFAYPNLSIQRKISEILKSLDEKIAINKKINNNIENISKEFFKHWFIDFEFPNEQGKPYKSSGGEMVESELGEIPKNWTVITIKDVCDANKGSLSKKDNWSYINYLDTSNITNNSIENIQFIDATKDKIPSRAKRKIQPNDIVYSTVRPNQNHYGIIKEPNENMIASTGFTVLRSKGMYPNDLIYLWLTQKEVTDNFQAIAEQSTSAYPSIKADDILSMKILLPSKKELAVLAEIIEAQNKVIWNKQQENKKLSELRDTLLPKLFSGEIEISNESVVN